MVVEARNNLSTEENELLKGILGCTDDNYGKTLSNYGKRPILPMLTA